MRFSLALLFVASVLTAQGGSVVKGPDSHAMANAPLRQAGEGDAENVARLAPVAAEEAGGILTAEDGTRFLLLRFRAPGAEAVRLHISDMRLPEGARMYVYGAGNREIVAGPYAGPGPALDNDFWTDAVPGEEVIVEVQFGGEEPADLPFAVTEIRRVGASEVGQNSAGEDQGTRTSLFRGMALTHQVVDGMAVFEKDIVLGPVDELPAASRKGALERQSIGITGSRYRWPNGVMPYVIHPAVPNPSRITNAIAHWNTKMAGYVKMVPRTTEANYVEFVRAASPSTCSSSVGMLGYGRQTVQTGDYCSTGNLIHEIGHAFGLWHEQSREDRDRYVKILWENIVTSAKYNFNQNIANGDDLGAYDYGSVMHYPAYGFSANGKPTIETIPPGIPIGQRSGLSTGDMNGIKMLYPPQAPAPGTSTGGSTSTTTADVTVTTNPPGLTVVVDGVRHVAPVTLKWTPGTVHTIAAEAPAATTTRYTFQRWSDGGAQSHTVIAPAGPAQWKADFAVAHAVAASATPLGGVQISPASADGFYPANAVVNVSATAPAGYCFAGWSGLLATTPASTSLTVSKPYTIQANFLTGSVTPSVTSATVPAQGGSVMLGVRASTGCRWNVTSNAKWATVVAPSGSGTATFSVSVQANTTGVARTATLLINNMPVLLTQAAQ